MALGCGVGVVFVTRGGLRRMDRRNWVELTWVGDLFDSVDRIVMPTAAEGVVAFVLRVSTRLVGHTGAYCQPTACWWGRGQSSGLSIRPATGDHAGALSRRARAQRPSRASASCHQAGPSPNQSVTPPRLGSTSYKARMFSRFGQDQSSAGGKERWLDLQAQGAA